MRPEFSTFRDQIRDCARFLIGRKNPTDNGWGLNIERGYQASSIVNTAEALYVIRISGINYPDADATLSFLRDAIERHPKERGDHLRYLTFGLLGLLQLGLDKHNVLILEVAKQIEDRFVEGAGWKDSRADSEVRLWPTFQSLWVLTRVFGADYVRTKYHDCLTGLLRVGREHNHKWSFVAGEEVSLAATAYALILLSEIYPGTPDAIQAHENVVKMLDERLEKRQPLELEAISGTDWHHYSYCWGLRAIQHRCSPKTYAVTIKALRYIDKLYCRGRGYCEPGKLFCNVRSVFNNILAVSSVIEHFDPKHYFLAAEDQKESSGAVVENSIFLSFSYRTEDKELVDGLKRLLDQQGYSVVTGEKNPLGSLSKTILRKIAQCEIFITVMTCRDKKENGKYTTSSWLLEEKGAALALGKKCLMLIEEGIDTNDIGGLQGDDQRLQFRRNNFTNAVADALEMLRK